MQDYLLALPLIVLFLGALLALLCGVFINNRISFAMSLLTVVGAFVALLKNSSSSALNATLFSGAFYFDPLASFSMGLILIGTFVTLILAFSNAATGSGRFESVDFFSEFCVLLLLSCLGACLLAISAQLAVFFISLEIMSLALYCLCGSAVYQVKSSESALKYFILGSFSSAVMMFGFALLFALTGDLSFQGIGSKIVSLDSTLLLFALVLSSVGVLFKLSSFPFHFWTADVYQGAPSSVTAFMASVIKVASFCAAIRVFWLIFGASVAFWSEFVPVLAVATMTVGTLMALRQKDLKRLLAFSSIAHSGYLMVGLLAGASESQGIAALLFYLALYLVMTLGTFAIVGGLIARKQDSGLEILRGLGKAQPCAALLLSFFLLCLAGLPPGVAGLISKIQLFSSAVRADYSWIVVAALINSAVGCYYYLGLIRLMYVNIASQRSEPTMTLAHKVPVAGTAIATICAAILLLFSVVPGPLLTFCRKVAELG